MCGIAGFFGTADIPEDRVSACLRLMRRRGPDAVGVKTFTGPAGRHALLLHARLSIIDLEERSNQPLRVGRKWIALNGELYNYVELGAALRRDGVEFRTRSDTEVFLTSIDREGWSMLDRAEGMWALAVYDESDGSLTLSRDRFGEKPLYLLQAGDGLYFGSEIKFIRALLGKGLRINRNQLFRYLVNGYKALYPANETFFENVEELPAACTLHIGPDGTRRLTRYWQPKSIQHSGMSHEEAVAGARQALIRSVALRLRADVPLAFCMSGGVDSVALISIAKQVLHHEVHAFTIVDADRRYDESEMVGLAVNQLGLRHTAIPVTTTDFFSGLRELIRYHDGPVYTITYYAHWLLMREIAAGGYRIAISGTGADELFSGYYDHHLAYFHDIRHDGPLYEAGLRAWREFVLPIVRNRHLQDPNLFIANPGFREHVYDEAAEFRGYLSTNWHEPFTEKQYAQDLLRNRMLNELFHEVVPVILHEDDLNAMYYSVENRSPYLDRELFEFCNTVPTRHLIRDGRAKAVLRDALRGIAPDAILDNRRKVGFNAPVSSFLAVDNPRVRAGLLAESPVFEIVRRDRIEELLTRRDLPNSHSKFLFNFVCARLFLEEFGGAVQ